MEIKNIWVMKINNQSVHMTNKQKSNWPTLLSAPVLVTSLALGTAVSADDLGEAATNPVSNLIQFRLQDQFNPSTHNADSYANTALAQIVMPLPGVASNFDSLQGIVTRTTVPYVTQSAKLPNGTGSKTGLGDTNFLAFAVPKAAPENTVWGFGPALNIPTAGDNDFTGSGQWQAGPAGVFMVTPMKGLQTGLLAFQLWDFEETRDDAKDVSVLSLQPILTKHFEDGWYVALPDTPQTYDFETNKWALNVGGVIGRVFPVGKQPMQIFGGVYYNPIENDDIITSEWTVKVQAGWLFPQ